MYQMKKNEIIVDNFAGGGGASTGIELGLDRHVDIAINHDPDAIDMHKINHPETEHYCESVWDVDPVKACKGRPVGLAWFSPDCKHFSKAKGSKPVDKSIRGLAWVAVRWAALVPVRVFMLENVEEFLDWGPVIEVSPGKFQPCKKRKGETFKAFIKCLTTGLEKNHPAWAEIKEILGDQFPYHKLETGLGYDIDHRILAACDYGTPTIRKRLFLVARNDKAPIVWPAPTHGEGLKPYRTAADIIDWSIPVKSIFNRPKPLAEKTLARIAKGIQRYVIEAEQPFIIEHKNIVPFITEHANGSNQRNMPADEPLRTLCAQVKGGHFAVVGAQLDKVPTFDEWYEKTKNLGGTYGEYMRLYHEDAITTSHMIKFRGKNVGHATNEPLHTISSGGNHFGEVQAFLIKYYGTSSAADINQPLDTVTTKDRFALVTVKGELYKIVDIGMRMLEPHELFAAMGFPENYQTAFDSHGKKNSKANQVARCGNAVCPPIPKALVRANLGEAALNTKAA